MVENCRQHKTDFKPKYEGTQIDVSHSKSNSLEFGFTKRSVVTLARS